MSSYKRVLSENIRTKVQGKDPGDVFQLSFRNFSPISNFTESKVLEFFNRFRNMKCITFFSIFSHLSVFETSEAAARRCSTKYVFLKTTQSSQEFSLRILRNF